MEVSAASPGGRTPGNPRGTHGLGRGSVAKNVPGDRGISALSGILANLPGELPTGFNIPWRGKPPRSLPGDLHTGFAHRLLSRCIF